jgi:transcriptional regulator with XRE-family HTH domain
MKFYERFKKVIKYSGLSKEKFADKTGLSRAQVFRLAKEGEHNPISETLKKIKDSFPEINLNWLMSGDDEMLSYETEESHRRDVIEIDKIIKKHINIISEFTDHQKALDANNNLIFLEKNHPDLYEKALEYINDMINIAGSKKSNQAQKHIDPRKKKTGS